MSRRTSSSDLAVLIWCALTALVVLGVAGLYLWGGWDAPGRFVQEGPFSDLSITLASVAVLWLVVGGVLFRLRARPLDPDGALSLGGFLLIALLYLNILRERFRYGDIGYYIEAATRLHQGKPLPDTYLYPPLWATILEAFLPLGEEGVTLLAWLLNLLSLFAFYFLLRRVLERYGFSPRLATLTTTAFLLVNAPVIRTLFYVQVNLHVANLIFLSLLLYPRRPFLSALSLALAVHLKTSPIVLLPAFLLERERRWPAWFVIGLLLVGAIPLAAHGVSPYLDYLHNALRVGALSSANFREVSFDSFFVSAARLIGHGGRVAPYVALLAKVALAGAALAVAWRAVRNSAFLAADAPPARLYNAIPSLLILMTLASPLVWVHHGVFLALPFLVLTKGLERGGEWWLFGFAYLLQFWMPTFGFFPWSYGRLLAPLIALGLLARVASRGTPGAAFARLNRWVESIPSP